MSTILACQWQYSISYIPDGSDGPSSCDSGFAYATSWISSVQLNYELIVDNAAT